MKGLYIHIPFCKTICSYCDFPKVVAKPCIHDEYITRVLEELEEYKNHLQDITTVYIGGGTPNSISLSLLERLFLPLEPILKTSLEVSIELNPELITEDLVLLLKKYHFNRVSLGVQTIQEKELHFLNRHHTKEDVVKSIEILRRYGIDNINLDFMFGIPNTTILDVKRDLEFYLSLELPHISYYSLILEEKTVLQYLYDKKKIELLEDDIVADMYEEITRTLKDAGYHHYEVSNFAYPGFESKHNLLYWNTQEYIGIGCGACGYIKPYRYDNARSMKEYLKEFKSSETKIDIFQEKQEYFLLGLRKIDGVSIQTYERRFHSSPFEDFNFISLMEKGLVVQEGDRLKIKEDKIFVANTVFEEFVGE